MEAKSLIVTAFLLFGSIDLGHSQLSKIAKCPSIKPKSGLRQEDIKGTWYEAKRYPSSFLFGTCVSINIESKGEEFSITTNQSYPGVKTVPQTVTFNRFKKDKAGENEPGLFKFKLSMGLGEIWRQI